MLIAISVDLAPSKVPHIQTDASSCCDLVSFVTPKCVMFSCAVLCTQTKCCFAL